MTYVVIRALSIQSSKNNPKEKIVIIITFVAYAWLTKVF